MFLASIEARALEFMSTHKNDLTIALAKAEAKLKELGHDVTALFEDEPAAIGGDPALGDSAYNAAFKAHQEKGIDRANVLNAMAQGTDPDITDLPPLDPKPETLNLDTMQPIPPQPPVDNHHVAPGAKQFALPNVIDAPRVDTASTFEGADAAPADEAHPLAKLSAAEDHIEAAKGDAPPADAAPVDHHPV